MALLGTGLVAAQTNQMKLYEVKSGKVTYELKGSGNIMGMTQISSVGKKRIIFSDYGVKKLEEEVKIENQTVMGKKKTNKTHTLVYMNGAVLYAVDFERKIINRMKNHGMSMANALLGGGNIKETGEAMMIKMGGKKTGTEKILGYTCDIWDLMGVKQCIYKGVPLKIESNIMGMKSTEVATKAEFDIFLSNDDFKLPAYPIYGMNTSDYQSVPKELDKSKLDAMDAKDNAQAKAESKKAAEGMKILGAGLEALAKTGIDMDKELTPEQEEIMKKAMMKAMAKSMGGEDKMLAKMKEDILKEEKIEEMKFAQECFGDANTLKEANSCVDKGNKMFDDDEKPMHSWTAQDKKEMLDDIKEFEKIVPCVKKAQTIDAFSQCMPVER